ncbi:hypothetical protein B9Z55_029101 [Caenorhabditis nigoni]|uniref:Uncharacterized protein n=1 Tax=Caenorhabditis nigoni TaxID=1611254 RepID=A0A2G5S8I9_9PELO|nr:hypothetical protein B9Z55_029101 [Caenorhabditis nigoni]
MPDNYEVTMEDEDTEIKRRHWKETKMSVEEIRRLKLERHKKKQELKMAELRIKNNLKRIQAIEDEIPLLKMMAERSAHPNRYPAPSEPLKTVPPLKPFIITRDAQQKQVFGVGYPGIPL